MKIDRQRAAADDKQALSRSAVCQRLRLRLRFRFRAELLTHLGR